MVSCPYGILALALSVCLAPGCRTSEREARSARDPGPGNAATPAAHEAARAGTAQARSDRSIQADRADWKTLYERWQYPDPIPDFALTDHEGRVFGLAELRDRHVLLGFIYTRCPMPEACPLTTEKMQQVQERWRAIKARGQGRGRDLVLLSITLDPAFDTPGRLKAHALERKLDLSSWILATGPDELVTGALPSLFNVLALPRGPGDVQHSVKVALLAPGLTIAAEWKDNEFDAEDVTSMILGNEPPDHPDEQTE